MYKFYIKQEIVEEKMQEYYGKDYKLVVEMSYQAKFHNTSIDIIFTKDDKAFWIAKYKGEYYMQVLDDIKLDDKYTVIDIYKNLEENAKDSLKGLKTK